MTGPSMNFNLYGTDKTASKALKQVGQTADETARKSSRSFADIGKALGAVGIVKFGADSVRAFTDAEKSQAKLTDAFQRFPKLADTSQQAIEDLSTALAQKTRFDDDATNSAAALLAQFNLTGRQIQTLLPLVQDYASKTGTDLDTAATQLGKSLLGQTRALKSVGINYTSTGDKAKDFANITGLLSQKLGGFAENEGKTAAGQMEILKNQFGEVEEAIGKALLPALKAAADFALPLVTVAGNLVSWFGKLPGPVKLAAGALVALKVASKSDLLSNLVTGLKGAVSSAEGFKSAIGGVGKQLATGGLVAGATVLVSAIVDGFNEHVTPAVVDFSTALDVVTGKLSTAASSALGAAGAFDNLAKAGVGAATYLGALQGNAGDVQATLDGLQGALRAAFASGDHDQIKAAATALAQFNTDLKGVADAQRHQKQEADAARAAMDSYASTLTGAIDAQDRQSRSTKIVTTDLATYRDVSNQAERAATTHAEALAKGVIANQKAIVAEGAHAVALRAVQTAASNAVAKSEALRDKLDDLSPAAAAAATAEAGLSRAVENVNAAMDKDKSKTYEDALREMHGAITDLSSAFGQGTDQQEHFTAGMVKANGQISTGTKQGQDLYDTVTRLASSQHTAAQAAFENAGGLAHQKVATQAAKDVAGQAYTAFMNSAAAQELGAEKAKALAKQYGLIPSDVSTAVRSNAAEEKGKVDAYNRSLAEANGKVVTSTIQTVYESVKKTTVDPITHFLFGASATGGTITGGVAGKDSVPTLLMPGEEVIRTDAANQGNNRSVLKAINAGMLHFAAGGSVPGAASFAGVAPRSLGDRESVSVGAFQDVRGWIGDLRSAAQDLAHDAIDAATEVRHAVNVRRQELADVRSSNAEKIRAARLAVGEAKTTEARAKARARLNAVEDKASDTLARATAEQNRKVAAARRESEATSRSALAANRKASAEEAVWNKTTKARAMTQALAQQVDTWTVRLGAAKDRLADLQGQRNDLAGSIGQFGGGILGFAEQRTNAASIIAGQKYDLSKVQGFRSNLSKLKALGLNSTYLSQIAAGGDDGMRIAAALASGSKSQISQVNRYASELVTASRSAADTVYGKPIADATKALNHAADIVHDAGTIMYHAGVLLQNGFDLKWNGQVMAKALAAGQRQLARR